MQFTKTKTAGLKPFKSHLITFMAAIGHNTKLMIKVK